VICLGRATKLSAFLMEGEKTYVGRGRLGVATDTQDASGRVVRERSVDVAAEALQEAARRFVGRIEQVPPMYSAVKVAGQKLYRLARRGLEVPRTPRPVTVLAFDVLGVDLPHFEFALRCSKGTYVRTLVHDLGEALGCGAHLVALAREAQGVFARAEALPFAALEGSDAADAVRRARIPPEAALAFLPACAADLPGPSLRVGALLAPAVVGSGPEGTVRILGPQGRLAAIGRRGPEGVRVVHVLAPGGGYGRGLRAP
jgi:tRNA pseudouridine55 synthase